MDARRASRTVSDPKVRHVGFITPNAQPLPGRTKSGPTAAGSESPAKNALSPVMIPPPRHLSDLSSRTAAVPVPDSAFRRPVAEKHVPVGSYNPSDSLLGTSPGASPPTMAEDGELEFSEESSPGLYRRSSSGKFASSLPCGGFDSEMAKVPENLAANARDLAVGSEEVRKPLDVPGPGNDLNFNCHMSFDVYCIGMMKLMI